MEALLISGVFLLRQLSRLLCYAVGGSVVSYRVLQLFAVADPERARGMCPHRQTAIFSREKYRQPLAYLIYLKQYGPVALC